MMMSLMMCSVNSSMMAWQAKSLLPATVAVGGRHSTSLRERKQ